MKFAHTSIWTSDIKRSTRFYEEVLGLNYSRKFEGSSYQQEVKNYYMEDQQGIELQLKSPLQNSEVANIAMDHIAFSVDDVDKEFNRVIDSSDCDIVLEPTTDPDTNNRFAFIKDPDGYNVEFVNIRE